MNELEALQAAVDKAGGQNALARLIGGKVRQGHVWQWLNKALRAPPEHCLAIERAVGVSRYALRPDIYGAEPCAQSGERSAA